MGGFLLGYDNLVISGTLSYLTQYFHLSDWGTGFAASAAQMGGLFGALAGGFVADKIGLKKSLSGCAVLFAVSALGIFFASSIDIYTVWRLVCGLASGAASVITPMYVAEIAPARLRGRLVTLYQIGLVFGIFLALVVNSGVHSLGSEAWRRAARLALDVSRRSCPRRPVPVCGDAGTRESALLMKVGARQPALAVLEKINGGVVAREVQTEIQAALDEETGRIGELFRRPFLRPLIIGACLAAFSQTSGINVILVYMPEIFKASGFDPNAAFLQSVIVSLVDIGFSFIALRLMDRSGRRSLILIGTALQTICFSPLAFSMPRRSVGSFQPSPSWRSSPGMRWATARPAG